MDKVIFFAIMLISSLFRGPGAWIGARLGVMARHAVGYLTAFLGAEIAMLFFNFLAAPDHLPELRGSLAILVGLLTATIVEAAMSAIEYLWPETRKGKASSLDVWDRDMAG
jgi:hypothetical protein